MKSRYFQYQPDWLKQKAAELLGTAGWWSRVYKGPELFFIQVRYSVTGETLYQSPGFSNILEFLRMPVEVHLRSSLIWKKVQVYLVRRRVEEPSIVWSYVRVPHGKQSVRSSRQQTLDKPDTLLITFPAPATAYTRAVSLTRSRATPRKPRRPVSFVPTGSTQRPASERWTVPMHKYTVINNHVYEDSFSDETTFYRDWTGVRTPGFKTYKFSRKRLPINPHSVKAVWRNDRGWYFETVFTDPYLADYNQCKFAPYASRFGTADAGTGTGWPTHDLSRRNHLITRLINKTEQGVNNVAQDIVEWQQFTQMIVTTIQRVTGAVGATRQGNFAGAIGMLWGTAKPGFRKGARLSKRKTTANNWLELQYGWKPLLADIQGAAESLAKLMLANPKVQVVTVSDTRKTSVTELFPGVGWMTNTGVHQKELSTTLKFKIRYRIDDHVQAFFNQIGFTNPVNLAWEVLPFSFVVDWFIPIGSYLEALTSFQGLSFVDGCEVRFTRCRDSYDCHWSGVDGGAGSGWTQEAGSLDQMAIVYDRLALAGFPSMTRPVFKNPLSLGHIANGLALMQQAFGGKR